MAIQANKHYLGVRMGATAAGQPLYAIQDPCNPGQVGKFGVRVGATAAGLPLYAHKGCSTATVESGKTYAAVRVGTTTAGLPLYAVPCQPCCTAELTVRRCNGAAVEGATVTIGDRTATTNASGQVSLEIPGPGTYTVTASKSPYPSYEREHNIACGESLEIRIGDQPLKLVVAFLGCGDRFAEGRSLAGMTITVERGTFLVGAEEASWESDGGCLLTHTTDQDHACVEFDLNKPSCGPTVMVGVVEETGQPIWRGYRVTLSKNRFITQYHFFLATCGGSETCG